MIKIELYKDGDLVLSTDDGMRWEGEVLKGDLFGYGCLYDEENELEYEGWMIEGKKRCYGIEYWNDIGLKKYCGAEYITLCSSGCNV